MEKALAGLLNAASGAEEVRGALVSRIAECAPLRLPAQPAQDPADTCAWTLKQTSALHKRPKRRHKRQERPCLPGCSALAFGPAAGGYSDAHMEEYWTSAAERGWACRWVAALKLLVDILRAEHRAALSVWPSEYTAAEPAFNEVVLALRRGRHARRRLHHRQQAHAREGAHWRAIYLLLDTLLHLWVPCLTKLFFGCVQVRIVMLQVYSGMLRLARIVLKER